MNEVSPTEIEIKSPHFRYAARKWGNPEGEPVLALHGWLDSAASFDHLAPLLPDMQLVALDFPGHGFSAHRPMGVRYHYLDYVDDVATVADALKWERFTLLGHSLGAGVASYFAGALPERVSKVVLIEGLGAMSRDPEKAPTYLAQSIKQMRNVNLKTPPVYKNEEEMVEARAKVGDMKESSVRTLVSRGVVQLEDGISWRSDPRLRVTSPGYQTDQHVTAFLAAIEAPVLLILAEKGIFADKDALQWRIEQVKSLKQIELPGSHHLHLDDPEPVAEAIKAFLTQ